MDHIHHDRTYKKSRFQQELEQSVSRKLISSLLLREGSIGMFRYKFA